ncbi:MAG: AzlC family ABC transporter permease [Chloroflexota bacterium]
MTDLAPSTHNRIHLRQLREGIKAELPIAVGVAPFGMIFGALALAAGLPPLLAQAMSLIVFAGSAQFIGVQLIGAATPAGIVLLTTFIINVRHVLYSASVGPFLKPLSAGWKWLLAYLLTDEAYAVAILHFRYDDEDEAQHWYLLGAGLTLWTVWQISTAVGVFLGAQLPQSWALDFMLPLTFIALVVPALKNRADVAAALVAGTVALIAAPLPHQLGLVAAALAGIGAGLLLDKQR